MSKTDNMETSKYRKRDILVVLIIWAVVLLFVPLSLADSLFSTPNSHVINQILVRWLNILPYMILFIIHHFLIAPLFFNNKKTLYIALTSLLISLFVVYIFIIDRPVHRQDSLPNPIENTAMRPEQPPMKGPRPNEDFQHMDRPGPPDTQAPPMEGQRIRSEMERKPGENNVRPIQDIGRQPMDPDMLKIIIALLLVGFDIGLTAYLKSLQNDERMRELKAENLNRQLETLRYQINPHFFMNTLNNIHALVDIDPDKAKESIEQFSKLMRIVLYEGNAPTIPLDTEVSYITQYISLMQIRYPDDIVSIDTSFPQETPNVSVPPLVLASFVENAFKHGVSYEEPSSIRILINIENGHIVFRCSNTLHESSTIEQHGMGLDNIQKRLALLYENDYTLHIDIHESLYETILVLPSNPPQAKS